MEHVVPVAAGGETTEDNLAFSCFACNRRKWDRRSGRDPAAGGEHRLFNPRTDLWNEHFSWSRDGLSIMGRSPTGRATVVMLDMNRERLRQIRAADGALGRHPPREDGRLV
jgi:hypothetical protein